MIDCNKCDFFKFVQCNLVVGKKVTEKVTERNSQNWVGKKRKKTNNQKTIMVIISVTPGPDSYTDKHTQTN